MKFIKEKQIMKINLVEENEKVYLIIDGEKSELNFDKLDSLIEEFITLTEKPEIECDTSLNNYKNLIEEIYNEAKTEDFLKAIEEAKKYNVKASE